MYTTENNFILFGLHFFSTLTMLTHRTTAHSKKWSIIEPSIRLLRRVSSTRPCRREIAMHDECGPMIESSLSDFKETSEPLDLFPSEIQNLEYWLITNGAVNGMVRSVRFSLISRKRRVR